jgi:hypothetical protein
MLQGGFSNEAAAVCSHTTLLQREKVTHHAWDAKGSRMPTPRLPDKSNPKNILQKNKKPPSFR